MSGQDLRSSGLNPSWAGATLTPPSRKTSDLVPCLLFSSFLLHTLCSVWDPLSRLHPAPQTFAHAARPVCNVLIPGTVRLAFWDPVSHALPMKFYLIPLELIMLHILAGPQTTQSTPHGHEVFMSEVPKPAHGSEAPQEVAKMQIPRPTAYGPAAAGLGVLGRLALTGIP